MGRAKRDSPPPERQRNRARGRSTPAGASAEPAPHVAHAADAAPHPPAHAAPQTDDQLAAALGVNRRTVAGWKHHPEWPGRRDGAPYDLAAIAAWRAARLAEVGRENTPDTDHSDTQRLTAARARREEARAKREEIQLALLRQQVVQVDEVIRLVARHVAEARTHLAQLPDWLMSLLPKLTAAQRRDVRTAIVARLDLIEATLSESVEEIASRCPAPAGDDAQPTPPAAG